MNSKLKYLIVISGPTAVGKSKVAIHLANHFGCDIIGADSRQVYKEMLIGTARPTIEDMEGINHHLIGHKSIQDNYTVGDFEEEAIEITNSIWKNNQFAILCGGTGLYIRAVLNGLDEFPEVSEDIISKWNLIFDQEGISSLQTALKTLDPVYFKQVDLDNSRRLIRALSVSEAANQPYSSFLGRKKESRLFIPILINLEMERELLYDRINSRVDIMLLAGLQEEVKSLDQFQNNRALQTVGYSEFFQFINGDISYDEAVRLIKRNSRRYAKRQLTWMRSKEDWHSFHPNSPDQIIKYIEHEINQ